MWRMRNTMRCAHPARTSSVWARWMATRRWAFCVAPLVRAPHAPPVRRLSAMRIYIPPIVGSAIIAQERIAISLRSRWSRDAVKPMPSASPPERLRPIWPVAVHRLTRQLSVRRIAPIPIVRVLKESEGFYIFGFTLVDGSQLGFSYLSCLLKLILLFSLAMG